MSTYIYMQLPKETAPLRQPCVAAMDAATSSTITTNWLRRKTTGTGFYVSALLLMSTVLLLASTLPVADCSSHKSSYFTKAAARTSSLLGAEASKAAAYWVGQISQVPSSILSALLQSFLSPLHRSARVIWSEFLGKVAQCEAMLEKATIRALNSLSVWVGQLTRLPRSAMTALLRSFLVPLFRSIRVTWSVFLSMVAQYQTLLLDATGHALTSLFIEPANAAVRGAGEGLSQLVSSALMGALRLAQSMAELVTSPGFFGTTSSGVSTSVVRPRTEKQDATGKSKTIEGLVLRHLDTMERLAAEAGVLVLESYLFGVPKAMTKAGMRLLLLKPVMSVVEDPTLRLAFKFLSPFLTLFFISRNQAN